MNVLESSRGLHSGVHLPRRVHMDQRVNPQPYMGLYVQPILILAAKENPRVSLGPSLRKFGVKGFLLLLPALEACEASQPCPLAPI
jgi:hypothetical protein